MTRQVSGLFSFAALFLGLLASLGWAEAQGFVSSDVTALWSRAIVQVDGPAHFKSVDAFFPPVPFALSIVLQWILNGTMVPVPFILSALLGAALLLLWFFNLRDNGVFSLAGSLATVALLGLNPFFLRAVADGPQTVLTILGTWVFTRGIVNLRLTGNAPDMMKVAVGLLIVALSDSFGLMICLGALPFMIVAARPSMLTASSTGYLVAMFYPVVAGIGSLMFVSTIFNSRLIPLLIEEPAPATWATHALILLGMLPVAATAILRNVLLPRLFMPLIAAMATVCGAYLLNAFFHLEGDQTMAFAPMLGVVAVAVRFWPPLPLREPIVLTLLALGVVVSAIAFQAIPLHETRAWVSAVRGDGAGTSSSTQDLSMFLQDKSGIMVDVERNPEIVTAMGGVDSLIVSGEPLYDWALGGGLPQAGYILVPAGTNPNGTSDRILRRFPGLDRGRLAGYHEVFQNAHWRVFERTKS